MIKEENNKMYSIYLESARRLKCGEVDLAAKNLCKYTTSHENENIFKLFTGCIQTDQ